VALFCEHSEDTAVPLGTEFLYEINSRHFQMWYILGLAIEGRSKEGILWKPDTWNAKDMGVLMSERNVLLATRFGFCWSLLASHLVSVVSVHWRCGVTYCSCCRLVKVKITL
jgi:hypothetical protein